MSGRRKAARELPATAVRVAEGLAELCAARGGVVEEKVGELRGVRSSGCGAVFGLAAVKLKLRPGPLLKLNPNFEAEMPE